MPENTMHPMAMQMHRARPIRVVQAPPPQGDASYVPDTYIRPVTAADQLREGPRRLVFKAPDSPAQVQV